MSDWPETIVLVANIKKIPANGYSKHMSRLDITKRFTNWFLGRAIRKNGYKLVVYDNLVDFTDNLNKHQNDLIFPYYFGVGSRIRQSYVQSICESRGIKFIGPDAYSQTIGNDKALSKEICRYAGINSPLSKSLFDPNYPPDISVLRPPLIVKPQFEGDSIGISSENVFNSTNGVLEFAAKLHRDLDQPIMIEEYLTGREISLCLIGFKRNIKKMAALEDTTLQNTLHSYNTKKFRLHFDRFRDVTALFDNDMLAKITSLFQTLDKLEYIRLDFMYNDGKFQMIELTADPDLSPYSYMYNAFKKEMNYAEFVGYLISNSIERYKLA